MIPTRSAVAALGARETDHRARTGRGRVRSNGSVGIVLVRHKSILGHNVLGRKSTVRSVVFSSNDFRLSLFGRAACLAYLGTFYFLAI